MTVAELIADVKTLPNTERSLLTHNERVLIELAQDLGTALEKEHAQLRITVLAAYMDTGGTRPADDAPLGPIFAEHMRQLHAKESVVVSADGAFQAAPSAIVEMAYTVSCAEAAAMVRGGDEMSRRGELKDILFEWINGDLTDEDARAQLKEICEELPGSPTG